MPNRIAVAIKIAILVLLLCGVAYFIVLLALPVFTPTLFTARVGDKLQVMDFVTWYEAGALVMSPDRFHIYDAAVQHQWLNRLIAPETSPVAFYIAYPPFFFPLMAPLRAMPMRVAYVVWNVLWPAVTLFVLDKLMRQYSPKLSRLDRAIVLTGILFCQPSIFCLRLGQTSWWLLLCLCLFFQGLQSKKDWLAGAAIAFSTIKPQYCLYFAIPGFALRRWKVIIAAAVLELVLFILAAATVGINSIISYPSWLVFVETSSTTALSIAPEAMVNLRGLLSNLLPHNIANIVALGIFLITLIYLYKVWCAVRNGLDMRWAMAITIAAAAVATPHLHDHDLIFFGLAAALTLSSISVTQASRLPEWGFRYWSLLLLYFPILSWVCYMGKEQMHVSFLALFNVILFLFGLEAVRRRWQTRT